MKAREKAKEDNAKSGRVTPEERELYIKIVLDGDEEGYSDDIDGDVVFLKQEAQTNGISFKE